jgi:sterol desaturase/sphingolipid hydroxylase (fatty acid hydroxylase superfamily)
MRLRRVPADVIYLLVWISGLYSLLLWPPLLRGAMMATAPLRQCVPAMPLLAKYILFFIAADLADYWCHRALHGIPLLWRFHEIHHSAADVGALTAFRFHAVELALRTFARLLPLCALGLATHEIPFILLFIPLAIDILAHGDLAWNFGFLGRVVVSPSYHRVHHTADAQQANANYGMVLTWWDLLFRTHAAIASEKTTCGIAGGTTLTESFSSQFFYPFRRQATRPD